MTMKAGLTDWHPKFLAAPRCAPVPTAWDQMETGLEALLEDFSIGRGKALEFGVDYGYSTSALANYFAQVDGVDTFEGDEYAGFRDSSLMIQAKRALAPWPNVKLHRANFREWCTLNPDARYDLIHIDIVHDFGPTYDCGRWAMEHAPVVIFHDTIAFPEVMRAVMAIVQEIDCRAHHWPFRHGLGILAR